MVTAAELDALTAVSAFLAFVDLNPHLVDEAGDGVALHAELGHPPSVDDVVAGEQQAHFHAARDDERMVDVEQVVLHLVRVEAAAELAREVRFLFQRGVEADAADG